MAFLKYMIKKGKKGMVYSLLLLPNMAWPFLFTSIHSLPIPATPLYKWDFFLDSQFMLGSMMVRICIYIYTHDICFLWNMYISKSGWFIMLHFGCFWLQRFAAAFSWLDHQRTQRNWLQRGNKGWLPQNEGTFVPSHKKYVLVVLMAHIYSLFLTLIWYLHIFTYIYIYS